MPPFPCVLFAVRACPSAASTAAPARAVFFARSSLALPARHRFVERRNAMLRDELLNVLPGEKDSTMKAAHLDEGQTALTNHFVDRWPLQAQQLRRLGNR